CFPGTGSVFREQALFSRNELCFSGTGSVSPEHALFFRNAFFFQGTGSVFLKRVLVSHGGKSSKGQMASRRAALFPSEEFTAWQRRSRTSSWSHSAMARMLAALPPDSNGPIRQAS